ncbi:MAG: hypothetical protein RI907_357 [Pseudomonadota bacterium]|jgi:acetate kinase
MGSLLVLNAGSSSLKFASYPATGGDALLHGQLAWHEGELQMRARRTDGSLLVDEQQPGGHAYDPAQGLTWLMAWLDSHGHDAELGGGVAAVGHRVVHGGAHHTQPVKVTPTVLDELDRLCPLAPLHQPHNLAAIRHLASHHPALPQVACFDTAFHATQPWAEQALALPRSLTEQGVRRYGFHGLSYEYIARRLPEWLGDRAAGRVIVAHLGSGASLCAMQGGRSVGSTMGFSALDGLMMGTRCGSIDPGVLLYLMQHEGMDAAALTSLLYKQSGLLGVSGVSADMAALLASEAPHAQEAVALFNHRVVREVGALTAVLGGLDALVFTAGIGEHAAPVRAAVVRALGWLGLSLDEAANASHATFISPADSRVPVLVVPTDEEAMLALHTREVLFSPGQP